MKKMPATRTHGKAAPTKASTAKIAAQKSTTGKAAAKAAAIKPDPIRLASGQPESQQAGVLQPALSDVLVDLIGFFSSPRRVDMLLREAGVTLDQALFPILVCLSRRGPLSVAALSSQLGRDHTTISRQLAKLTGQAMLSTLDDGRDRRVRTVTLTATANKIVLAIHGARQRLLAHALAGWSARDQAALAQLNRRLVDTLTQATREPDPD